MRTFAWFWIVFVMTLLMPHIGGLLRLPYIAAYMIALYFLLWRGIRRV